MFLTLSYDLNLEIVGLIKATVQFPSPPSLLPLRPLIDTLILRGDPFCA